MATGTVTVSSTRLNIALNMGASKLYVNWTSDAFGNVDQVLRNISKLLELHGNIKRFSFIPDAVGVPTHLHNVILLDDEGVDVLTGDGVGLEAADTRTVPKSVRVDGGLSLMVTNAGNAKKGQLVIYLERQV